MADKDLEIKIRTTADTAGVDQTLAGLDKIKQQQATWAATQASVLEAQRAAAAKEKPPPVPPGLAGGPAAIPTLPASAIYSMIGAATFLVNGIRRANEEQVKQIEALSKASEKINEIAEKWSEIAATTENEVDLIRQINSTMPTLADAHKKVIETQKQGLGFWQGGAQGAAAMLNIYTKMLGLPPLLDAKTYQKTQDQIVQGYKKIADTAEEGASEAFKTGKALADSFEADKLRPVADVLAELGNRWKTLKELQGGLNTETREGRKDYADLGNAIRQVQSRYEDFQKRQERAQEATDTAIEKSDAQVKAILMNEQAAATAKAAGQEREADLYTKSAEQYKKSATPQQLEQLAQIHAMQEKLAPAAPGGPKAGVGESQEAIDQIERNRKAFEDYWKSIATPATGAMPADIYKRQRGETGGGETGNKEIITWLQKLYQLWQ